MSLYPTQFTKDDKKLVAITPRMREFFKKSRILARGFVNIEGLSRIDLREFKILLQEEIDHIAAQLNRAKANYQSGKPSDIVWYRRAETAKKVRGRYMLEIQLQETKLKQEYHKNNSDKDVKGITKDDWRSFHKVMRFLREQANKNEIK